MRKWYGTRWSVLAGATALAVAVGMLPAAAAPSTDPNGTDPQLIATEGYLGRVAHTPSELRRFLEEMPKGGDLHHHLGGAVRAESLIGYAARDGKCVDTTIHVVTPGPPPCAAGQRPATDALPSGPFRRDVIAAWSMRGFVLPPDGDPQPGHDHFFDTFEKFGEAATGHDADMLAEVARDSAKEHSGYLETLVTPEVGPLNQLADRILPNDPGPDDLAAFHATLVGDRRFQALVRQAADHTDRAVRDSRKLLGCDTGTAPEACRVAIRFDYQVLRALDSRHVFAQQILGFELVRRHLGRFVGVNMVQPEDAPVALRDYTLHMRMVDFLKSRSPGVRVSLHAGELVEGLKGVHTRDLTFHINEAVDVARADRIGHGVDLAHERDPRALTARMRQRHVLVEAPLISNAEILRVSGDRHPLRTYLNAGVPVALATDDPGVSRSDLTAVFQQAFIDQELTVANLRTLTRASLDHAFIEGADLWKEQDRYDAFAKPCAHDVPDPHRAPSAACRTLLNVSPKAAAQWQLEVDWREFENRYARR
ncbi:Aminodeoxyfutalosine deaminase [Streptomyces hundungensis]|uniref:adenosine deaminase n=1 Tax=Streptomyces hundungensis TaxID=1077946 RepID=A0A387HQ33_9ACTN|nr:adenosine deaminase [Streptomyces hundungensis]AYG84723.1 Aminodeoxyfutalosine deaminase [Streptomyces hundungensis]